MPHAAIVYKKDQPMKIEEVRHRPLQEGEAMVRLAACGVCHSDLSILDELFPAPTPVILGHEAAGVVEEVGPKVTSVGRGDHVVALWRPSCGTCRYCRSGRSHLCKLSDDPTTPTAGRAFSGDTMVYEFLGVGGFSEYSIISENALVKIDKSIPLQTAALLGCAVITGFGAAHHCARVREGDEVAVFGCGGVGLNIIQGARHGGARTIIAIDLDDAKLEFARRFGATHTLNGKSPKLNKEIRNLTFEGQGVDYAFDAVGNVGIATEAYLSVCRGGSVISVGSAHIMEKISVPQLLTVLQEKCVRGSVAGSHNIHDAIPSLISLYQQRKLMLDELVTKTYPLRDANEAMDDLRRGRNARGVLVY
jgi:S-(hydroxymethyl)glutathione dehydrogenase/alcohol dehydrogenase